MPIDNTKECNDLKYKQARTVSEELQFTENGVAVDITGWTVYFTVKSLLSDADVSAVISKTITVHSNPTDGKTLLELSVTDTNLIGSYFLIRQVSQKLKT